MSVVVLKWIFTAEGLLFALLGIPLALGRIPPNGLYGFRTAKTLSSPEAWYAANRSSGIDLTIAGILIALAAFIIPKLLRTRTTGTIALANVAFSATVLTIVAIRGWWALRNL